MRKMSLQSFSGTGSINYNDDVLTEILLCLPAKSLTRFKLVSKSWLTLISSHQFCHLHTLRHHKTEPSLILNTRTSQFFYFHPTLNNKKLTPYRFTFTYPKFPSPCNGLLLLQKIIPYRFTFTHPKILNSCNGLLLMQINHDYYIHNPTTKTSRKIILTDNNKYTDVLGLTLAFDPSKSVHYKIVCVRATKTSASCHERCCQLDVYDSLSRTWKVYLEPFTAPIHVKFTCGVHWNNVIHWEYKMYYDIEKNVIQYLPRPTIPWPEGWGATASCCQLQESKGHLYFFIIISNCEEKSIAVFELQGNYSHWVLKYNDRIGPVSGRPRILSFIMGDGEKTSTLVFHVPGKIKAYKFLDKSFTELVDLTNEPFYREGSVQFEPRDTYQFGESLAPV